MLAAGALIAQQVAGKATRDALFLSSFQVSSLPLVMIASALTSALAVVGFSAALSRRSPARVVPAALGAGSVLLIAEWGLSLSLPKLAAVAVYLHMAVFGATVVSGFWSLVNERFDPYTAKRVMGRIGLGASMGGVAGGLLAWSAAGTLPVTAMLLGMAAFNVVCLFALARLGASARAGARPDAGPREATGRLSGLRLLGELPYLRQLALIVFLGAATETLLDYVLNAQAAATFARGEPLMSFFALFHTGVGLLALIAGLMFSRSALRGLGLAGTVALRPAAVAVGALLGVVDSRLWTALLARGAHGVLHNSLFRSGYELLYTPLPERLKRPTKAIVDVGFDRLGTLVSGSLILVLVSVLPGPSARVLFALAAAGGLAALIVSRRLHWGYISALEESLLSGAIRLEAGDVVDSTTLLTLAHTNSTLGRQLLRDVAASARDRAEQEPAAAPSDSLVQTVAALRSGQPETLRKALRRTDELDPAVVGHVIPLLASNEVFLDALRALRRVAARSTGQLLDVLLDPRQDVVLRARVARVLRACPTQRAADGLLQALADPRFAVRRQCALTLARIIERDPALRVPRDDVFAATLRELEAGTHAWGDAETAIVEESTPQGGERPQSPSERGLSHVFTLLSLLLEREPLRIAHWAVFGQDQVLRGTALEYLQNVLPDSVRAALWPYLGVRSRASRAARPRQQVVEELMRWSGSLPFGRNLLKRRSPDG
jgi:hypothetical protein